MGATLRKKSFKDVTGAHKRTDIINIEERPII